MSIVELKVAKVRLHFAILCVRIRFHVYMLFAAMGLLIDELPGKSRTGKVAGFAALVLVVSATGLLASEPFVRAVAGFVTGGLLVVPVSAASGLLWAYREGRSTPKRAPLRGLIRLADWLGLETRRAIKALAGDYAAEIRRLRRERRHWAAKWNHCLAWGYAVWYVFRSPFDMLVRYLVRALRG